MIDFVPCQLVGETNTFPTGPLWDRLCTENAIVTEKHIFPDKAALFLLPLSSFLSVTNTLSLIDGIVSNHTSLSLSRAVSLYPHAKHTQTHIQYKQERVRAASPKYPPVLFFIKVGREEILNTAGQNLIRLQKLYIKIKRDVKAFVFKTGVCLKYMTVLTQGKIEEWRIMGSLLQRVLLDAREIFLFEGGKVASESLRDGTLLTWRHYSKKLSKTEKCITQNNCKVFSSGALQAGAVWNKSCAGLGSHIVTCRTLAVFSHLPVSSCWLQLAAGKRRINQCCQITMQIIWSGAGTQFMLKMHRISIY